MPAHNNYFPLRIGDQIQWLKNYRLKIGNYQATGGYLVAEIIATQADADFCILLLETWLPAVAQFAQGATAYGKLVFDGPASPTVVTLPAFNIAASGTAVAPGALKRIFAFIANLKTRAFYTPAVGQDLGIIGAAVTPDPTAVPKVSAEALGGEVLVHFTKSGHTGVWIESQVGAATAWSFLAIDSTEPYNDTRPLAVPGQPEVRRYRVCFWDSTPTNVWADVLTVTFGG